MRALVFGVDPEPVADPLPADANTYEQMLRATPMGVQELEDPKPLAPDWLVLDTRLCGICGSDTKQVFMDTGGDWPDASMTAFISFPQVLGHEVVGTVHEVGDEVRDVEVGQRVLLQCWLSCGPRGITPMCPPCEAGDYSMCWNFLDGRLAPGIHVGNSSDAPGGFGELVPAHASMAIPIPDDVTDEVAVLADPFSVALHAVTRTPPPAGGRAVVWGAGALGSGAIAVLRALYPSVEVCVVARTLAQQSLARSLGAHHIVSSEQSPEAIVVELAEWSGGVLRQPWDGLPIAHPGFIDAVYDTVGTPATLEQGLHVMKPRGSIAVMGVNAPGRFEWSPLYFKEVKIVGSNAFGIEAVEGVRKHAMEHYLDLVRAGRVDVSAMLTHRFPIDEWRAAFTAIARQDETGAIKVAFDYR
jgi:threonine dehydrogenase-like Zn-dependent dehydrogenase